jgi:hypothetical protein
MQCEHFKISKKKYQFFHFYVNKSKITLHVNQMCGGIFYLCRQRPLNPWLAAGVRRSAQGHHQLPTSEPFSFDMFGSRTTTKVVLSSVSLWFLWLDALRAT